MLCEIYELDPPGLGAVAEAIGPALASAYASATADVVQCPDLTRSPFYLASRGLSGRPIIADIGGQANLFPRPLLDKKYSMIAIAQECMQMSCNQGMLIGAGAGPFDFVGQNSELAPNLSWKDRFENVNNLTYYTKVEHSSSSMDAKVICQKCSSIDCALMMNLFGSSGLPGSVLRLTARKRTGSIKSFTDVIRFALRDHFGDERPVSLGGVFVIKRGKANFHVMPDFPSEDRMPFKSRQQVDNWLTFHNFDVKGGSAADEIVCLSILHSADPDNKMSLRMEHTHCFSMSGRGGHYHYDLEDDEVEYEGYFNVAEAIYRVDRPGSTP